METRVEENIVMQEKGGETNWVKGKQEKKENKYNWHRKARERGKKNKQKDRKSDKKGCKSTLPVLYFPLFFDLSFE